MKKFFYLVAIVATVVLTACGGKTEQKISAEDQAASGEHECVNNLEKLSAEDEAALKALVSIIDEQSRREAENDDEVTYKGTELVGRDIVITTIVDESELPTIKSALSGENMDNAVDGIAQVFVGSLSAEDKPLLEVVRRCKSTIILRYEGSRSHEKVDLRIPSEKLPE